MILLWIILGVASMVGAVVGIFSTNFNMIIDFLFIALVCFSSFLNSCKIKDLEEELVKANEKIAKIQ